ncbi:bifunctional diaminohydroxyphosphoribosylaminopyrimidine deaminase/5-amino-6-(5-phosphoribosylamino)uracil reductase RibD [Solicola gregarius]|uniref:Riboflavin biosynthesis protein RibD n=1 Tax=Solicola gregarius TaxID=2908642 RepID=A0AA46YMM0_9ACTN|nr:bifunctional diaminohydroxyphosphoribosylaminopyrimidine deaminase/5-amino-6-(5-phosphoribosylamino)uracil reductase RibD [Solicola gregarius]UYM07932.1 bifunctional diaminohydroxyphosphoribosylaminopyrimidine deaminase/5-amino-6-(5-phosphoribosylamino)uracil reductase RibD [Solicola gregarius]
MREALRAARASVRTHPNPRVGCILLADDGSRLAVGVHQGPGTPHAEVDALQQAGERARGATAIVTLEPCNHTGRTGPCSEALIAAGVRRVVVAQAEPTDQAAGGAARLAQAGVDVESGVLADEAYALNEHWTRSVRMQRPFVTWKLAATIDGRSAAADGTSRWISGPEARRDTHRLRAAVDAIVVGTGTVLIDNPRLTVRDDADRPIGDQPLRVVIGTRELPADRNVWSDDAPTRHLATRDVREALKVLYADGVRDVWLEGGPTLAGAFLDAGAVDEVIAYVAPMLLGSGLAALQTPAVTTIADAWRLEPVEVTTVGTDVRITARPRLEPKETA